MLPCVGRRTLVLVIVLSGTLSPFATLFALMTFLVCLWCPLCLDIWIGKPRLKRTLLHSRYIGM